mmetsp:Transcript_22473/g.57029  ORF Transcript_22473/g.57029 Transcript_22473/m.57029 type:complete len:446 (+) Transcript_22473:62-1399(+)
MFNLTRLRATAGALGMAAGYGAGQLSAPLAEAKADKERKNVVVVGGGAAGLSVASMLLRKGCDVVVVEPAEFHYYQPGWTLVGGGVMPAEQTRRPMSKVMPSKATWIKDSVKSFDPDANSLTLASGKTVGYDYLVVAAGLSVDFARIKGLAEAVGHDGVSSIYDYSHAQATWRDVQAMKEGVAIFTQPSSGVKCGGAPQKIMWLAEDYWKNIAKVRDAVRIEFHTGIASMFGVEKYRNTLDKMREARHVDAFFKHELIEVDGKRKQATFKTADGTTVVAKYDMLHVTPLMGPPAFISSSKLAEKASGYVEVDKETLQHVRYPNVFSCGDCSSLPTSKTAAAITVQAPVLVHNLLCAVEGGKGKAAYDGYTSCPIVTRRGGLILAEFKYGGALAETFNFPPFFDQGKEWMPFYYMKTILFPWAYWNAMPQGRWYGTRTIFEPSFKK